MGIFGSDWSDVFAADVPIFELFVRATVLYFSVFIILRSTLRRSAGELSMLDFIFVLLVANGAADAMTGGATSIVAGLVTVVTVVAWNYVLNSLSFYIPLVERLVAPPPLQIVRDGKMLRHNMRKEFLSPNELMGQLREQGIEDVAEVRRAHIEGDGNISVITFDRR
jgi:uncharacterized membrane protein YcaP (DUF421 family)